MVGMCETSLDTLQLRIGVSSRLKSKDSAVARSGVVKPSIIGLLQEKTILDPRLIGQGVQLRICTGSRKIVHKKVVIIVVVSCIIFVGVDGA